MAEQHRTQNPLIGALPGDTINNISSVIDFLRYVEAGQFDSTPGEEEAMGRPLILQACRDAVQSLHGKVTAHG